MSDILKKLEIVLKERKNASIKDSYVASLYNDGEEKILKKIAEEASEVIMATKDKENDKIILEITDLLFHMMILLGYKDISFASIEKELTKRYGISGIDEKNSRKK